MADRARSQKPRSPQAAPFSAAERWIALRYLRARRQEGFISVIAGFSFLGIVLGVATLIVVLAVMNGFRAELLNRVLGFSGHVLVFGQPGGLDGFDDLAARIARVPGVAAVTASVEGEALLTAGDFAAGVLVKAVRPEDFARRPLPDNILRQGTLDPGDGVVIGASIAARAGLDVGDRIVLTIPRTEATTGASTGGTTSAAARLRGYPVRGIVQLGMSELDGVLVLMRLDSGQSFFELGDRATYLEVFLADPSEPAQYRQAIDAVIDRPALVRDWQQFHGAYLGLLQVQRNMLFLILALIVLVAAFNVISGLVMLVQDKARDIAILRTMGAGRGLVLRVFLMSGIAIGAAGTLVGVALGVLVADNIEAVRQGVQALTGVDPFNAEIYYLTELPARIVPAEVLQVAGISLVLSLLATLYPSWRAARLQPVAVLRHE